MTDEISLIEQFFDEELSPELVTRVEHADHTTLHTFRERHREFEREYRVPPAAGDHYRPYVNLDVLHLPELTHGVTVGTTSRFYESDNQSDLFAASDAIKHHLLYCHAVVLNSPIGFIADLFSENRDDSFERNRANLANVLCFLIDVKPLIQNEILVLIPRQRSHLSSRFNGYPPGVLDEAAHKRLDTEADFSSVLADLPSAFNSPDAKRVWTNLAENSLLVTLLEEQEQNSRLDLYMPHLFFKNVFRDLLTVLAGSGYVTKRAPIDAFRMGELARTELPKLADLTTSDIVNLRQNEEAFEFWRAGLSRALDRVPQLDLDLIDRDSQVRILIREELGETASKARKKIKKSRFMFQMTKGLRPFTMGAIGSLATAAMAGPLPAITAGAVGLATDLVWGFLRKGRSSHEEALLRHFAVL